MCIHSPWTLPEAGLSRGLTLPATSGNNDYQISSPQQPPQPSTALTARHRCAAPCLQACDLWGSLGATWCDTQQRLGCTDGRELIWEIPRVLLLRHRNINQGQINGAPSQKFFMLLSKVHPYIISNEDILFLGSNSYMLSKTCLQQLWEMTRLYHSTSLSLLTYT